MDEMGEEKGRQEEQYLPEQRVMTEHRKFEGLGMEIA